MLVADTMREAENGNVAVDDVAESKDEGETAENGGDGAVGHAACKGRWASVKTCGCVCRVGHPGMYVTGD